MKVGDLVRDINPARKDNKYNTLAYVTGFDGDGDPHLRYINPSKTVEQRGGETIDYKSSWKVLNENR
tara:strand:- start:233 stop:433 length:201 start_codon:yes stop_codon:yes gene_type:complete